MYPVSSEYRTSMSKPLRNYSYIKVNINITDPDIATNSVISTNGSMFYSDVDTLPYNIEVKKRYATFEPNAFILNGDCMIPPEVGGDTPYYQGFIGTEISGADGTFVTNPKVTLDFTGYFSFVGLTFRFDEILGMWASELQVLAYNDGSTVYNKTFYPTDVLFVSTEKIPTCNKIEIIVKKTSIPYRRAVMACTMLGLVKSFTDAVITDSEWSRHVDLLSTELPTSDFSFTAIDVNKEYNPDSPSGLWGYLEDSQQVSFSYGYQLDSGAIEWISGGNMLTTGEVTTESSGGIATVTFKATSILNQLEDIYYKGKYNAVPVTLYSLAQDVLEFAGLHTLLNGDDPWYLDPVLQTIYTSAPLPVAPINEVLQIIANAGRCVLFVNRFGQIRIERLDSSIQPFELKLADMKSMPTNSKLPPLKSVDTTYTIYNLGATSESLSKTDYDLDTPISYQISYEMSTNITYTTTGTLTVVGTPEFYAETCIITLTGTGTLEIFGKKLITTTVGTSYISGQNGYSCPVENSLIDNRIDAYEYATWVADILEARNQYEVEDRGFPELAVLDNIQADTMYANSLFATVTGASIKYNGALSGTTKYIIRGGQYVNCGTFVAGEITFLGGEA